MWPHVLPVSCAPDGPWATVAGDMARKQRTPAQHAYDQRRAKGKAQRESRERTSKRLRSMARSPWGCAIPSLMVLTLAILLAH